MIIDMARLKTCHLFFPKLFGVLRHSLASSQLDQYYLVFFTFRERTLLEHESCICRQNVSLTKKENKTRPEYFKSAAHKVIALVILP